MKDNIVEVVDRIFIKNPDHVVTFVSYLDPMECLAYKRKLKKAGYKVKDDFLCTGNFYIKVQITRKAKRRLYNKRSKSLIPNFILTYYLDYKLAKAEISYDKENYKLILMLLADNINPERKIYIPSEIKITDYTKSKLKRRGFDVSEIGDKHIIEW